MARIRKRNGKWEFEINRKNLPRKFGSGFKTKREAQDAASKLEGELIAEYQERLSYSRSIKLIDILDRWLEVEILSQPLDHDTKTRYIRRRNVVEGYFKGRDVNSIVRSEYQEFLNWYGQRYEVNELGRMNANITKAVNFAIADKMEIDDSFLKSVKLISQKRSKHPDLKYLHSKKDYDKVLEFLLITMDYKHSVTDFVVFLLFTTPLRPSEVLALKWDDIDFENQEIHSHCRWSSHKHRIVPPKNDYMYRKANRKNPAERKVPMSLQVKEVLQKLEFDQKRLLRLYDMENEQNFVFYQFKKNTRHPVPDESTVNKRLKTILRDLNIHPIITAYGARHTYGSVKIQEGVPIEVLARWFGHKDTATLREVYLHLMRETEDEWSQREKGILES